MRPPPEGAARLRWFFLVCALVAMAAAAVILLAGGRSGWPATGIVVVTVLPLLAALRVADYRRRRLGPWPLEVVEAATLLLLSLPSGPIPVMGVVYAGLSFRAVLGSARRLAAAVVLHFAAVMTAARLAAPDQVRDVAEHGVGMTLSSTLMYVSVTLLSQHERTLVEAERRTRNILETAAEAFIEYDADLRVTEWNTRAEQLLGWSKAEALGRPIFDLLAPPELRDRYETTARAVVGHGPAALPAERAERRVRHRNGTVLVVEVAGWVTGHDGGTRINLLLHDITARKWAETALQERALSDPLSGLANRTLLIDRLGHALQRSAHRSAGTTTMTALLLLDVDNFKMVNDGLGHTVGDRLLVAVAARLRGCATPADTLARLGGDEFALLLEDTTPERAAAAAQRMVDSLAAQPVRVGDHRIAVTGSVGVALATRGETADVLLRDADVAMYAAKVGGKNRIQLLDAAMQRAVLDRLAVESVLRDAPDRLGDWLGLAYQPIVELQTGRLLAVEALLRCRHPRHGDLPPERIVPVAEETGAIIAIGGWVLREASEQLARWRARDPVFHDLAVSVNVSVRQVTHAGFADEVLSALRESQLPPSRLALEITEGALSEDVDAAPVVARLRSAGVRIAIDDFGTGYSSLSRLAAFPVDLLKIDQSFVDGLDTEVRANIVAATVAMAHRLRIRAVAEGVETPHQLDMLRRRGCDAVQGNLIGEPMDPAALHRRVVTSHQWLGSRVSASGSGW